MDTSSLRWEEKLNGGAVLVDCQKYHAEIRGTAKSRFVSLPVTCQFRAFGPRNLMKITSR